jgi:hypothetical protein
MSNKIDSNNIITVNDKNGKILILKGIITNAGKKLLKKAITAYDLSL